MARALGDLLSDLPERRRQGYLGLPEDLQSELARHIEEKGRIPPLRRLPILFGPDRLPPGDGNRWMLL